MTEGIGPFPTTKLDNNCAPVPGVTPFTIAVTVSECERLSCKETEEIFDPVTFNIDRGFEVAPDGIEARFPSGFENVIDGSDATSV
jgi:hypothetical protein